MAGTFFFGYTNSTWLILVHCVYIKPNGIAGIGTDTQDIFRDQVATDSMVAQAFTEQNRIGWHQFVLGRIAKQWREIGPLNGDGRVRTIWARRAAQVGIEYGLVLWCKRNTLVHGTDGRVSKLEKHLMINKITTLYDELQATVQPEYKWLFSTSVESKIREPYSCQVAWVDSIRRLCPEKYEEVLIATGCSSNTRGEIERQKMNRWTT